ncbi:hypothetical protein M758_5G167700 [Ceratodon purpureus]|nr:hypothetical protein M758_5G167700 [Ceratodon purpureus]
MSDSPKPGLQWYWGGREGSSRASSPAPTATPRDQEEGAGIRPSSSSASSAYSREENEAAELVLEQLDEQWFCDNVVRWPSSRPGSPPGVIDKEVASPFRRREFLPSGLSSTTQADVATGVAKPRPWTGNNPTHLNPPRTRQEIRRLSDGDHHLRRHLERDQIPRRRIPEAEDHQRRLSDISNSQSSSLPQTPTKFESGGDQSRFRSEASTLHGFSPLALPPPGPLMGVTEDEEMENDLFAKMLANRPAKLTTINPGRLSRGPLQENQNTNTAELPAKKPQLRQRRRLKGTKSLTDLEYEELRGLKDLGFEVSKDDLTPHVVRMFPGLQRQGIPPYNSSSQGHGENQTMGQSIGHPSQNAKIHSRIPAVQHLLWPRRPDSPLLLNAPSLDPSIDMKGQLKSWASEMASIVSIEC